MKKTGAEYLFFKLLFLSGSAFAVSCAPHPDAAVSNAAALTPVTARQILEITGAHRGERAVVVNFWATWCAPCVKEFPEFVRAKKDHPADIEVIFVSADFQKDEGRVREFLAARGVDWETFIKAESDQTFITSLSDEWTGALPATFVFGKSGRLCNFTEGVLPEEMLKTYIEDALEN